MVILQRLGLGLLGAFWLVTGVLAAVSIVDFGLSGGGTVLGILMVGTVVRSCSPRSSRPGGSAS